MNIHGQTYTLLVTEKRPHSYEYMVVRHTSIISRMDAAGGARASLTSAKRAAAKAAQDDYRHQAYLKSRGE
jgi:hypothetical protein